MMGLWKPRIVLGSTSPDFVVFPLGNRHRRTLPKAAGADTLSHRAFSDSQSAIWRISSNDLGPGQQWARGATEVCTRLIARQNRVMVHCVPAHEGVAGNETADDLAKQEAERTSRDFSEVPDQVKWQVSLSPPHQRVTEQCSKGTAQWVASHVRPERRYRPPGGSGLRRKAQHRVRKSLAGRYYQLLSGHAAIGSFLHERMTGPLRLESRECRWRSSGKRESRHHLFTECQAWAPRI